MNSEANRQVWRDVVRRDPDLSNTASRVGLAVDDLDGHTDAIASHLGITDRELAEALDELRAADLIDTHTDGFVFRGHHWRSTRVRHNHLTMNGSIRNDRSTA